MHRSILRIIFLVTLGFVALSARAATIFQASNSQSVAWEAEDTFSITNAPTTLWIATNDATASGNRALYQAGENQTAFSSSFAFYTIKFRTAGTYSLYIRWRGDKARTDQDANTANSYRRPIDFGDLENDPTSSNFTASSANNSRQPPDANNYAMIIEGATYMVTQEQVDAGQPLILKVGTREAGMFLDRFVFSQSDALTEAEFNALPNSGSVARPAIAKAVGSATLNNITVMFDRALTAASVSADRFQVSGGVVVTAATLDATTSKDVILTTSAQVQGSNYLVTVNGVTDVSNNPIAPDSKVAFSAWKIASGWITRELYYAVLGTTVAELQGSANFPDRPSAVDFVRNVSIGTDLQLPNLGARFRGFFTPPKSGAYEFYIYGDDDAVLSISSGESPANLAQVLQSVTGTLNFDANVVYTTGTLIAGQRYLFEVLFLQVDGAARLGLAARSVGTTGSVAQLTLLSGSQVSAFVNPDAGVVDIRQSPFSTTVPAGSRAKFSVSAIAPKGGTLFYQWQVNGADILGATRPTYVTPVLTAGDSGNKYRCIVGVGGSDVPSQEALLTVGPAQSATHQPYVGINFVGGGGSGTTAGAAMASNDVAGVVLQEFFNNIAGGIIDGTQSLVDSKGSPTAVTIAVIDPEAGTSVEVPAAALIGIGTGESSADHVMLQGYVGNNNLPQTFQLSGVPAGNYSLIVYSVGFNFNSTYEEDFSLVGAETYPTLTVQGQRAIEYLANPMFIRMSSTNAIARDKGNYVQFDNISPTLGGLLTLTVNPQTTNVGNAGYFPPVNAIQLVKVVPVVVMPTLSLARQGTSITISWTASASGFVLESSSSVGADAAWETVAGTPNPISGVGSTSVSAGSGTRFYRLRK